MRACLFFAAIAASCSAPLLAQQTPASRPRTVLALLECRAIVTQEERLACFDRAAAALAAASAAGDIVIVDREEVRAARNSLFGFSLPKLRLFGGSTENEAREDVVEIKSQVKRAISLGYGKYRVVIADNDAAWETSEASLARRDPRPGDTVHIKKGSFGSYFIRIASQPWVKTRRVQ